MKILSARTVTLFGTIATAALVACAIPATAQSAPKNDPNDTAVFSDQDSSSGSLNSNQPNLRDQSQSGIDRDQDSDLGVTSDQDQPNLRDQNQSGADMDHDQDSDLGVTPNNGANLNDQDQGNGNAETKGQYYQQPDTSQAAPDTDKDSSSSDSDTY